MTSLANNFSMEKSLFKYIFGLLIFICKPIFKIFAAHFRTKGMLNHDEIIFCMRLIHSVAKHEKPPSKRPRIRSRHQI